MQQMLPSAAETAIFAATALIFACIAAMGASPDVGLALLSIPLFLTASLMGFRRYRLARVAVLSSVGAE